MFLLKLLGFFKLHWKIIAIVAAGIAVLTVIGLAVNHYVQLNNTVHEQQAENKQLRDANDTYKAIVDSINDGNNKLNAIEESQRRLSRNQSNLIEKMNEIEVTTEDQPFSDPGMLARAELLREYQSTAYPESER